MIDLSMTAATSDQSMLFTGEQPEHGTFLALIEHSDDGWPAYVTVLLDGEPVPLEALADEAAERIADISARIIACATPPQPEANEVATGSALTLRCIEEGGEPCP